MWFNTRQETESLRSTTQLVPGNIDYVEVGAERVVLAFLVSLSQ